jgi:RNA polymerase sigma-70 factor (ECF subfamily)
MPEALEASSLHGFQCDRQLRLELYSATFALAEKNTSRNGILQPPLKKEEPHPGLQHCFGGKRDRGEPLMLNVSVRPQPAAVAAVSALAATAGKTSSDEILVEQIAAGSKPAMQALFARHRTYVYRWLLRLVSNETLAEDLLSEVFLDVWRQAGRFQCRSSVSTWLMSIARHKALSARRRRTKGAELDEKIEATIADPANDPEVALQEKDRGELVRRALMRSIEHREVIDLVYYHEKSVDEVAQILDVPPATVKTRMFYARKKLAELVNDAENSVVEMR